MRTRPFDRILLASAALALFSGGANALTPTLQFEEGPVASVPITTGSFSFGGVTVNGVPLVGSIEEPELQVNGSVTLGPVFNPLDVRSTEYNRGVVHRLNFRHDRAADFARLERLLRSRKRAVRCSETFGVTRLRQSVQRRDLGILPAVRRRFRTDRGPFLAD
jgi:hypothetical protein